jgi:Tfp pilus assembly protein PilF
MDLLSVKSLYILADTQQRLGREVEARNSLLKAIKLQPMNYATWELLAKYERDLWNEQNLAQQHFAIALELNPYDKQLRKDISKQ